MLASLRSAARYTYYRIVYANKDYLTVPNALCWLYLSVRLLKDGKVPGNYAWVKELTRKFYGKKK